MVLVIFLSTLLSFANSTNNCPAEKELPNLPVHDQDGLGTCASNTAALMIQHNLGLAESPSYFQLSLTTSGNEKSDFFFNQDNQQRVFNWGAHICDVVKTAKKHGYCDAEVFEKDVIGRMDPIWNQQKFLVSLASFIDRNTTQVRQLGSQLQDPAFKEAAKRRLASHLMNRSEQCSVEFEDFVTKRALARIKVKLDSKIASLPQAESLNLRGLRSRLFNPDGSAQNFAMEYFIFFLRTEGKEYISARELPTNQLSENLLPNDNKFLSLFSSAIGQANLVFDFPPEPLYRSDFDAYRICSGSDLLNGLDLLVHGPQCQASLVTESTDFLNQSEKILNSLINYRRTGLDPEAGLVNLISPGCAVQMMLTKNNDNLRCSDRSIGNQSQANRAKRDIYANLCRGKAVAISMCTGFFASSVPINSAFCESDVAGIANHGRHALTLIGYRTKEGKKQIKIQNSWGQSCPFLKGEPAAIPSGMQGLVECEMENGRPTGRFWVDEDLLINNSYQLSVMP